MKNNLYDWCLRNEREDLILLWDNAKNDTPMKQISISSNKKCYFIYNNISYSINARSIAQHLSFFPKEQYNNSFGTYLIEIYGDGAIEKYWSDKNETSPFEIARGSGKTIWIKCTETEYHGEYQTNPNKFYTYNQRCPYCASKKIHILDSFGQYCTDHFGVNWEQEFWGENKKTPFDFLPRSNKKINIKCRKKDYHAFSTTPSYYLKYADENGDFCPYCTHHRWHPNDNFANEFPEIVNIWSDKNKVSPYEVKPFSLTKYWFNCDCGKHEDYQRCPNDYKNGSTRCPKCVQEDRESSFQKKMNVFLNKYNYTILHEYDCSIVPKNPLTKRLLPFDTEIKELKLIIEIHGGQHYSTHGWIESRARKTGRTPEEELQYLQWKDEYKKQYALSLGYSYIAIPYWNFDNDNFKIIVDKKIKEIINLASVETAG